jgi:hypothetical protein
MEKYLDDIMPSIFKSGKFISSEADMKKIKDLGIWEIDKIENGIDCKLNYMDELD